MSKKELKTKQPNQSKLDSDKDKQFEEWKEMCKNIKLSKTDEATLNLATSTLIDVIMNKAANSLAIFYGVFQRNYKIPDSAHLEKKDIGLSEVHNKNKEVGKCSMKATKDNLEFCFTHYYMGCDITISYKNKLKIF